MITCRIKGGLGNQLFQYAAGLLLAERVGAELQLDIGSYVGFPLRRYHLAEIGVQTEADAGITSDKLVSPETTAVYAEKLYRQASAGFDEGLLEQGDSTYLDGYWQSYRYLDLIEPTLRANLSFDEVLDGQPTNIDPANRPNAVALHVRRGDYAAKEVIRNRFGLQSQDYYSAAAAEIGSAVQNPHFFVFSDEIDWVEENLSIPGEVTYVEPIDGEDTTARDFALMSRCSHFITANSTFSWWAAWLGATDDSNVICPKNWYADQSVESPDFIPPSWLER